MPSLLLFWLPPEKSCMNNKNIPERRMNCVIRQVLGLPSLLL